MDIEAVRNTLEQASTASLAIGLAIGFFFSFNPVALAVIPVSLAYVTGCRCVSAGPLKRRLTFNSRPSCRAASRTKGGCAARASRCGVSWQKRPLAWVAVAAMERGVDLGPVQHAHVTLQVLTLTR